MREWRNLEVYWGMGEDSFMLVCRDRAGIVAEVSGELFEKECNLLDLQQHSEAPYFAMRALYEGPRTNEARKSIEEIAGRQRMEVRFSEPEPKVVVLCSKEDHCLSDLLWRFDQGDITGEVVKVISTSGEHRARAESFGVEYRHLEVGGREEMPRHEAELLEEIGDGVDLVVLARYMRILSGEFLDKVGVPVINIHHSFLPAFIGRDPYRQAHERGVKIIGATAHYVSEELDAGPIIDQEIVRVSHRESEEELKSIGRDIEKLTLARAVKAHLENRVAVIGNRTIVF